MSETYYDVLGVEPSASVDEIRARYHELANRYHPDHNGDVPETARRHLDDVMSELNVAWATLSEPGMRLDYDRMLRAEHATTTTSPSGRGASASPASSSYQSGPVARPRRDDECIMCGSHPVATVTLRQATGKVIWWVRRQMTAPLCRDCGMAEFRDLQNRTMLTGWWGVISFFANCLFVLSNSGAALKLRNLEPPTRTDLIDVPLPRPLAPGKSIFARPGIWVTAVVVAGLIVFAASGGATSPTSSAGWSVGSCVEGTTVASPVDCSESHDGKIIATRADSDHCPFTADGYVDDDSGIVYCIDSSQ